MRYLALDLGTKTCGVAISDKTNILASPLKTIRFQSEDYKTLLVELEDIIKEKEITNLVIGKPLNMDGSSGFATRRSDYIYEELKKLDINISFVDERYTSVFANNILKDLGKSTRGSKKLVDTVSACLILETHLRKIANERKQNNN